MIECFSVMLSRETSEDKTTNQMSAFLIVERMGISPLGAGVPFHILAHWFNGGDHKKVKVKFRISGIDHPEDEFVTPEYDWELTPGVSRVRMVGFNTPKHEGFFRISTLLQVEDEDQWRESAGSWICQLQEINSSEQN